jgi:hypothetical protein
MNWYRQALDVDSCDLFGKHVGLDNAFPYTGGYNPSFRVGMSL